MAQPSGQVIEGVLERVVFCNEENAWTVARLAVPGRRGLVTAVGNLLGVQVGESLRLQGHWIRDPKYGEQFKVEACQSTHPSTLTGIERYLGSGLVPGIGKAMAARIVAHFGLDALEVIEHHPERLTEVEGIGPGRSQKIQKAWSDQGAIKEVMIFLQGHGVSPAFAARIYKLYGQRAISLVKQNPYRLAEDILGIGFLSADRIAQSLGIHKDSPRRAEAGVLHTLGELAGEGHVFCPRTELLDKAAAVLELDPSNVAQAVDALASRGLLVQEPHPEGEAVYLRSLHQCESGVTAQMRAILATPSHKITIDVERALAWFEKSQEIKLAEGQREAIRRAVASKVLVITGGPGTGKTTVLNGMIRILEKKGRRILLCAPTGRAAKKMAEATGRKAKTIHRLLEFDPKEHSFQRDAGRPLEVDLLVADEVSMVDISLFCSMLGAIPRHAQLVLVGDADQLPSVGPGNVLRDLIGSGAVEVVTLSEIFRQAARSQIVINAHRVNRGELPGLEREGETCDFFFVEREDPAQALETILELTAVRLPRAYGLDPIDDIQVLAPMHKGILGVANLNRELQALLNPKGESLARGDTLFRMGDKVMQIRNNYDLDVFNGDIGRVKAVDPEQRELLVQIDDRQVLYQHADLDELAPAYACSIHKAQGSEYPAVVIPLHTQHYVMLQRNLLYTGITRGRRLVVLVGSRRAVSRAVANDLVQARYTWLAKRLAGVDCAYATNAFR